VPHCSIIARQNRVKKSDCKRYNFISLHNLYLYSFSQTRITRLLWGCTFRCFSGPCFYQEESCRKSIPRLLEREEATKRAGTQHRHWASWWGKSWTLTFLLRSFYLIIHTHLLGMSCITSKKLKSSYIKLSRLLTSC